MMVSSMVTFLTIFLVKAFPCFSQTHSDLSFGPDGPLKWTGEIEKVEKRSLLTYPPSSALQINMGVALAGQLERNKAAVVFAFQQNFPLPVDPRLLLSPSVVVSDRKFSIYDHLRDVIASYGFSGSECLRKIICQIGEAPLMGGLVEDIVTFALSPSKHRGAQVGDEKDRDYLDLLLEAERLGKLGGNCSSAFPQCVKTPLDFISAFVRI